MRLTLRQIQSAELQDQPYVMWDDELNGFGVRVWPKGKKSFVLKTRVGRGRGAKQVWLTIGTPGILTVEDARRKALGHLAKASEGIEPVTPPRSKVTVPVKVCDLCELWLEKGATRSRQRGRLAGSLRDPKNIGIDRGRINAHILPLLGEVKLADLKMSRLEGFRDAVARGDTKKTTKTKPHGLRRVQGGEGTATRTLRLFSSILSFGVREGVLASNPAIGIEKTPDRSLERFLSPEEMRRLGESLDNAVAMGAHQSGIAIIRMLALSGARKGEIESLNWSMIDLQTGFLRLTASKTGAKLIPITGPMRAIFDQQSQVRTNEWVFPSNTSALFFQGTPKLWLRIRKHAELEDVRLHDLRHSAASFGLAGGLGLEVIGKLLGHKDVKTTRRYAHLSDGYMKSAAETMADGIAHMLDSREPLEKAD
jgi:integrase